MRPQNRTMEGRCPVQDAYEQDQEEEIDDKRSGICYTVKGSMI